MADAPIIAETAVETKGLNHPDFEAARRELETADVESQSIADLEQWFEAQTDAARATIDRITETVNEQIAVEVEHEGDTDTTYIDVGTDGAAREETVYVQIAGDGTVSAATEVVCH